MLKSLKILPLVLCLFANEAAARDQLSLSGTYLAGRTAGRERDTTASAAYIEKALQLDPANIQLVERLFGLKLANGKLDEAKLIATKIIGFNSQHRMARLLLGLDAFKTGKLEDARTHFAEASYTPMGQLTSSLLTAWTFAAENNSSAAMKELDNLKANSSFNAFRALHQALIADFTKNKVKAAAAFTEAYKLSGSSLRVTQSYGQYMEANGKHDLAIKAYEAFIAANNGSVLVEQALANAKAKKPVEPFIKTPLAGAGEALFSIAAAMNDEESLDVSLLYGQLAILTEQDLPVVQTLLGDVLASSNNFEGSNEAYAAVPATSPLKVNAEMQSALNLQRLDRKTEALDKLKQLAKNDPKNVEVLTTLGNVYRNNEQYAEAEATYTAAINVLPKVDSSDWQLFFSRGIASSSQKKWDASEADFRKALELSPDEPSVLNYLGYSLIDLGQKQEEAFKMVQRAVELKPNDGYIVDSLGWGYFKIGDYENAVVHLERAVELKASDPLIADHLGDAYWHVGRKLEAKFQWQHALDNEPEPADAARIKLKMQNGLPDSMPAKPAENTPKKNSNG